MKPETEPFCPYCRVSEPGEDDAYPMFQDPYNKIECGDPNCDCAHVYPGCQDHPDSGADPEYCKKHATLTLVCHDCGALISATYVADKLAMIVADHPPFLFQPESKWKPSKKRASKAARKE